MNGRIDIKLLYVEDESATREEVLQMLKRRVREVLTAADGREGLELFRRHSPDLVVTDIRMPAMDGLEMAERIKKLDRLTPVILTTAYSDSRFMLDAIDIGVDQYVLKPVDAEQLIAAVGRCHEVIDLRRAERRHREERESLITELQAALSKVKLLSGFLPICASCKKIRDDKGYWQQIEAFIRDHSEAEFSHSICPDCAKTLYPEYYDKPSGGTGDSG